MPEKRPQTTQKPTSANRVAEEASRDEVRTDPSLSDGVKRAMEHFWNESDRHEGRPPTSRKQH